MTTKRRRLAAIAGLTIPPASIANEPRNQDFDAGNHYRAGGHSIGMFGRLRSLEFAGCQFKPCRPASPSRPRPGHAAAVATGLSGTTGASR
jgi:hypothetical protein